MKNGNLWEYKSIDKSMQQVYSVKGESIYQSASSPDGKYIAIVASPDNKSNNLKVIEIESKKVIEIGVGEQPTWFLDSNKLLFSEPSGTKKVFYLSNKKHLILDSNNKAGSRSSVAPDGRYLITYNPYNEESDNPKDEIVIANFNDREIDNQNALWIFDYSTNLEWKNENTFFAEKPSGGSGGNDIYEITMINKSEFKSKYIEFGSGPVISPDRQYFIFESKQYYDEGGSYGALAVYDYKTKKTNVLTPAWPNGMGSTDTNYTYWRINNYEWVDSDNIIFSKAFYKGSNDLENNQPVKTELWAIKKDSTDLEKITDIDNAIFSTSD